MTIIDTVTRTDDHLPALRQAGVVGVIRYYCKATRISGKRLTRQEAEKIVAAGLSIAVVHQGKGDDAASFSRAAGERDGAFACDYATRVIGQLEGSAIYFGVDYDAPESDIRDRIIPYFRGVQSAFQAQGGKFRIGVYGSGAVCQAMLDNHLASFAWLSQSSGHRGSKAFLQTGRWTLHQLATRTLAGIGVDPNDLNPLANGYGEFDRLAAPGGGAALAEGVSGGESRQTEALQLALRQAGYPVGPIDGIFGPLTRAAVFAFQADQGLPVTGVGDETTWAALDRKPERPLSRKRLCADADTLRADGSRVVMGADKTKLAGLLSTILGGLGLSNSAAVVIADKLAGAAPTLPAAKPPVEQPLVDMGRLVEAIEKAAGVPNAPANAPEVKQLLEMIGQLQGSALERTLAPESLQILNLFKKALASSPLMSQDLVARFFEHLPTAAPIVHSASKSVHTVFDLLPGLFANQSLQTLFQGASVAADSVLPGFGGSLLTIALGLAVRRFSDRAVAARVEDHRSGANLAH
jgi:hypothetical protein